MLFNHSRKCFNSMGRMQKRTFTKNCSFLWYFERRKGKKIWFPRLCQKYFQTGDLIYCNTRGITVCCYHNESCSTNYDLVNDRMTKRSVQFLSDPRKALWEKVRYQKYDTCHAIIGYDASKCAEDCEALKHSVFAKNCASSNGLYKCCIR